MSFTEKVDVLDLLIKILEEHEKRLDELVSKLERLAPATRNDPEREIIGRAYGPVDRTDWR